MHMTRANVNESTKLRRVINLLWAERYGYPFDDWVQDRLDRGASFRQIERELADIGAVELTHVTLSKWFGQHDPKAVA